MKNNALIKIKGKINDNENIEFTTIGSFLPIRDGYAIKYKEGMLSGFGDTTTTLTLKGEVITLQRAGDSQSVMVFENQTTHTSYYGIAEGGLSIKTRTRSIDKTLNIEGGNILIDYAVEINDQYLTENQISLEIKVQ